MGKRKVSNIQRAQIFAALSDPTRLQIIELLLSRADHMSGSQLAEKIDISMPLLCHHWKVLAQSGLIEKRRSGQTTYCSLNRNLLTDSIKSLLDA